MPTKIDQSDDFATFIIDGKSLEIDIYEANDRLVEIDRKHKDDPTECGDCEAQFPPVMQGNPVKACPHCQKENLRPSQAFLDDVKALVVSYGAPRCGRHGAGQFYEAIISAVGAVKKNTAKTPESPTGTTSTQVAGAKRKNTPSSKT
jgi:hypothetical protein